MIAYVDSSVLLRVIFAEPNQLKQWKELRLGVSTEILRTECLRTVDRMRIRLRLEDAEVARRNENIFRALDHIEQVPVSREILDRAADPFPTMVGTLDAIHLATAILWQASERRALDALLTHDLALGQAARALGYRVLGCPL